MNTIPDPSTIFLSAVPFDFFYPTIAQVWMVLFALFALTLAMLASLIFFIVIATKIIDLLGALSKSTPGPWHISKSEIILTDEGYGFDTIAKFSGRGVDEDRANARLASASPNMKEAIELMVAAFDEGQATAAQSQALGQAKAALRKAVGESDAREEA